MDRGSLLSAFIRAMVAYCPAGLYFGANSVLYAIGQAVAALAEQAHLTAVALRRRLTKLSAQSSDLDEVLRESGLERLGATRARVLLVFTGSSTTVTDINVGGGSTGGDLIEVEDSSAFAVGSPVRIRNADASVIDARTVIAITTGTGPNGGDEIDVATLSGTYDPGGETTTLLLRSAILAGTRLSTSAGIAFTTLSSVTIGDENPILDGASQALALADKTWAEADVAGVSGNVPALTITTFIEDAPDGVLSVTNPEAAAGGADTEADFEARARLIAAPSGVAQESAAALEVMAQKANSDVLRFIRDGQLVSGVLTGLVLHRNSGAFSSAQLIAMQEHMQARLRSGHRVSLENVVMTAVEVEARVTLAPGYSLEQVFQSGAAALVALMDYRRLDFGTDVDEAKLLSALSGTEGIASVETSTFLPAADVVVGAYSLPVLARLSLMDTDSGVTINASLSVSFS
jgi:uncharacterized phage protein gp47/JayE